MIITNEDLAVLLKHKYNVSNETIINELKQNILNNMEQVTIEKLSDFNNVWDALYWAEKQYKTGSYMPTKPKLNNKHSAAEAMVYGTLLADYEYVMEAYRKESKKINEYNNAINTIITDYICMEAGLQDIPEQYRSKVWSKAYQDGHSEGHIGIYNNLLELIDIFN